MMKAIDPFAGPVAVWSGLFRVLSLLILLMSLGACKTGARLEPIAPDGKILAFGDSLTFGTGVLPEQSYPAILQNQIKREVINAGVPGEITAEGLRRLPIWLKENEPRLLILTHGANDMLRALSEEKLADNLRAMIRLAQEQGVEVMLVAVPRFGLNLSPPPYYEAIAKEFNIPIERHALADIERVNGLKVDAVHLNAEGNRLLAQAIAKRLKKAGAL